MTDLRQRRRIDVHFVAWLGARDTPPAAEWRRLFKVAPFPAVGLVAVSPIACATAPPLVWLAGALDVSVSFFVYSRDG